LFLKEWRLLHTSISTPAWQIVVLPSAIISGIGMSRVGRPLEADPWDLTLDAIAQAIEDAGLTASDIDGVSTYPGASGASFGSPGFSGAGVFDVIELLGLQPKWFTGGEEIPGQLGAIINAVLAVSSGVANNVLCFRTVYEATAQAKFGSRAALVTGIDPNDPNSVQNFRLEGVMEYLMPYGSLHPVNAALVAQRYFHESGMTRNQLSQIALNGRINASNNPSAVFRSRLTLDDYMTARMISEPLCIFDCDVPVDGSVAIVVSSRSAKNKTSSPIVIESFGSAPGIEQAAEMMWRNTELTPQDVQVAEIYDGFSIYAVQWLEALGFCRRGDAGLFLEGGARIALDGPLPLSTGGGQLSAGRLHGYGHVHEACVQLRELGGDRQVSPRPQVAVVTNGAHAFTGCLLLSLG
jgi:acetyl-CoA acetyltransferase